MTLQEGPQVCGSGKVWCDEMSSPPQPLAQSQAPAGWHPGCWGLQVGELPPLGVPSSPPGQDFPGLLPSSISAQQPVRLPLSHRRVGSAFLPGERGEGTAPCAELPLKWPCFPASFSPCSSRPRPVTPRGFPRGSHAGPPQVRRGSAVQGQTRHLIPKCPPHQTGVP